MVRPRSDEEIDALVRSAAEVPVNEGRMAARLNAALSVRRPAWTWGAGVPGAAMTGFVLVLVATPLVIARGGGIGGDDEALMAALAFGDPRAIDLTGAVE